MDKDLQLRIIEAALFMAEAPLKSDFLHSLLPGSADLSEILADLEKFYQNRGVQLRQAAHGWFFTTAGDLSEHLVYHKKQSKKLSRAAMETLSIIAYHQPITRSEIEEMRGVSLSRGTLDMLLEIDWIRPLGKRRIAGQPVTWGITDAFLVHFGLNDVRDLPGVDELKASGFVSEHRLNSISMNSDRHEELELQVPIKE